jgi:hypothetical protein
MVSKLFRKPLHYYTREEVDEFKRTNRDLRWALRDIAPYLRARDQRSFRHWVFTFGWLACLTYYEDLMRELVNEIKGANDKTLDRVLERWETRTRLGLLGNGEDVGQE